MIGAGTFCSSAVCTVQRLPRCPRRAADAVETWILRESLREQVSSQERTTLPCRQASAIRGNRDG